MPGQNAQAKSELGVKREAGESSGIPRFACRVLELLSFGA
jgi:hypothetical protein